MAGAFAVWGRLSHPRRTLPRMRYHTSPLVVAVTYPQHGHTWAGRVASWDLRDGVWWAHVLGEYGNHKAGAGGGWIRADELEPAQHAVRTTHGGWEWGTWEE